jgi:hypothetical protein
MNIIRNTLILGIASASLLCLDNLPVNIGFIGKAEAIIGRPATPMSYAGVARRSAYVAAPVARTAAVATTAAVVTTAAVATSAEMAAASQPVLEVGTTVAALPGGCESATINGVDYKKCGGVYYRPAYQGNTLVYVVSAP